MYRTRNTLLLLALATLGVLTVVAPAAASFSTSRALDPMSVTTVAVAPPGAVDASGSWCNNGVLSAVVRWTASTTARVSEYSVTAYYRSGISKVVATTGPMTTSFTGVVPNQGSSTVSAISVTTSTDYGWTADSGPVSVPAC